MASRAEPRNADERRIALLFDYENIALGLSKGSKKLEIQPILDRVLEKGRIVVKRAYADPSVTPKRKVVSWKIT